MLSALLEVMEHITGFHKYLCLSLLILNYAFYIGMFSMLAQEEKQSWRTNTASVSSDKTTPGIFSKNKKKAIRDRLLIVGPVSSGKTSLYYRLLSGELRDTVSSVDLNQTRDKVNIKVPLEILPGGNKQTADSIEKKTYEEFPIALTDIPGHYNFKSEIT